MKPIKSGRILSVILVMFILGACSKAPLKPVSPDVIQRIDLAPDLYLREIGEGAYVITHSFPWPANSVLVEMDDGTLVLAGTPYTPEATQQVLDWAGQQFGDRALVAIDTGYHFDNLGGNQSLIAAGVPVYGSDLTVQLLADRGEEARRQMLDFIGDPQSPLFATYQSMTLVPPDRVFQVADGLTLTFGREDVLVVYPGPSQAPDKLAVYFPSRRLLFGSCMILGGDAVGNTADADLLQWPMSVRRLESYLVDVVVPGHGERLDPGLIQHTLDVLEATP